MAIAPGRKNGHEAAARDERCREDSPQQRVVLPTALIVRGLR